MPTNMKRGAPTRALASTGKRLWLVVGLVAAFSVLAAGLAFGAAPIVGTASNTFDAGAYTIDQGDVAQLQVLGSSHNVTAHPAGPDGKALFRSSTISAGTTPVDGTQYLSAGDYTFFCSVHPGTMQATLHVTGAGAPLARPQATLSVRTKTISKALKKGILVGVNTTAKDDGVSLTAKLGKTTIGQATRLSLTDGQQFEVVKLSKAGKSMLSRKDRATITVSAELPFGSPATAKGKLS
jgi:plastocyanin